MKNKILLILAFVGLCFSQAVGQIRLSENKAQEKQLVNIKELDSKSKESKLDLSKVISLSMKQGVKEDTLYCTKIGRRKSWIVGIGDTLTKEDAMKRSKYYRLSMKNDHGKWQHIEAMSKTEMRPAYRNMCYYDGFDIGEVDGPLSTSINEISQWFEFSDLEGENMLEERAYDAEGNLILTGMFHRHEDGRIIVCYNDSHGFPVDFKPDDKYTYGHVFAITYDDNGNDHIVEYYDGTGYSRMNAFGCYQYRQVVDERGYIVEMTCHNSVGHLMNCKFGFARRTNDVSTDEKHSVSRHYDGDGNLVKSTAPASLGYMIEESEFDDNGEIKSWKYFTVKNGEITNDEISGVHCYLIESLDNKDASKITKTYDKDFNEINK